MLAMAHPYEQWTSIPDEELIAIYNEHAPNVVIGLDFITGELTRRAEERRMAHLEKLNEQSAKQISKVARLAEESQKLAEDSARQTRAIVRMTKAIVWLTVANVIASGAAAFVAATS